MPKCASVVARMAGSRAISVVRGLGDLDLLLKKLGDDLL